MKRISLKIPVNGYLDSIRKNRDQFEKSLSKFFLDHSEDFNNDGVKKLAFVRYVKAFYVAMDFWSRLGNVSNLVTLQDLETRFDKYWESTVLDCLKTGWEEGIKESTLNHAKNLFQKKLLQSELVRNEEKKENL